MTSRWVHYLITSWSVHYLLMTLVRCTCWWRHVGCTFDDVTFGALFDWCERLPDYQVHNSSDTYWAVCFKDVICGEVTLDDPCLESYPSLPWMVGLAPKWVRLAPNGTNPGLFQIRFQCIWRGGLKKPRICPILGQSDPLWSKTYHPCLSCSYWRSFNCTFVDFYAESHKKRATKSLLYLRGGVAHTSLLWKCVRRRFMNYK